MTISNLIWDIASDSYLMEKNENAATTVVYTNEPVQFGQVVSQWRGNLTTYYHFDGHGSARELTDHNGDVTDEYSYSAFGEDVAVFGVTVNSLRFAGSINYYFDTTLAAYYVRARSYVTSTGRWLCLDPIGLIGLMHARLLQSANLYQYVNGNPVIQIDPSGQSILSCTACPLLHGIPRGSWYGCHCGPGNAIGVNQPPGQLPIDPVDNCCLHHDAAYAAAGCALYNPFIVRPVACDDADRAICRCLLVASCNRYGPETNDYQHCMYFRAIGMSSFLCHTRFGIPVPPPPPIPED